MHNNCISCKNSNLSLSCLHLILFLDLVLVPFFCESCFGHPQLHYSPSIQLRFMVRVIIYFFNLKPGLERSRSFYIDFSSALTLYYYRKLPRYSSSASRILCRLYRRLSKAKHKIDTIFLSRRTPCLTRLSVIVLIGVSQKPHASHICEMSYDLGSSVAGGIYFDPPTTKRSDQSKREPFLFFSSLLLNTAAGYLSDTTANVDFPTEIDFSDFSETSLLQPYASPPVALTPNCVRSTAHFADPPSINILRPSQQWLHIIPVVAEGRDLDKQPSPQPTSPGLITS